jgi:ribonuclease HIII
MALIEINHPAASQDSRQFWEDELKNTRILLADVNERIHKLEIESYSLDTGQDSESVSRSKLDSLVIARTRFLDKIREIEQELGIGLNAGGQCIQAVPF